MRALGMRTIALIAMTVAAPAPLGAQRAAAQHPSPDGAQHAPSAQQPAAAQHAPPSAPAMPSPYRDQQFTEIKGLTDAEVRDLRNGAGMGFARAAELNGYPGPRHVLDALAAGQMHATPEQRERVQKIFDDMAGKARTLGATIIAEEAALESAFRAGTIDEASLRDRVARIETLRGQLRAVHLAAHLETRAVLSPAQIARYNELRGYQTGSEHSGHQHKGH